MIKLKEILSEMPDLTLKNKTAFVNDSPLKNLKVEDIENNIVVFRQDKENSFFPFGLTFVYFMDTEESAKLMAQGKIPFLRIPVGTFNSGGSPITDVWKKKFQKPGTEHILGLIEGITTEEKIFIDMISVRPGWQRNKIATLMYNKLKKDFPNAKLTTSDTTDKGEKWKKSVNK